MSEHPSQLALDRVALGESDPAVAAHAASCARCAQVLAERRAEPPVPAWARDVRVAGGRLRARGWRRWAWLAPIPALAAAAALVVAIRQDGAGGADGTRAKGAPLVQAWVKRGESVSRWDGRTPLRTGDRVRLTIHGSGYGRVSIASLPGGAPDLLYEGALARDGETALPLSFRVDGAPQDEVLSVILSNRAVATAEHAAPAERKDLWWTRLHLRTEAGR